MLSFPMEEDATASSSAKKGFIVGGTKNNMLLFFFKMLSPIIVRKYLAAVLDAKNDGYRTFKTSWMVADSGIL